MALLARWGTIVPLSAAIGLAVSVLQVQGPLSPQSLDGASTYCYSGVRTHDEFLPQARCFSVQNGLFSRVWAANSPPPGAVEQAGFVIPGLWDGHGHLSQYGEFLSSVDLFGTQSIEEALLRIHSYVADNAGAGSRTHWIRGAGWDQVTYGRMPTAQDLDDAALRGAYVMLDRVDIHCVWVSQAVLDLLPPVIPDVPGGEVVRDPGLGVFCDNAMDWVMTHWPKPGRAAKARQVKKAMARLSALGLVGMHDAGQYPADTRLYAQMAGSDDWTVRVYGMCICEERNGFCPQDVARVERADHRLTVRSVKLFADGALGSWGSALLEPYADRPWTSGSLLVNATRMESLARSWAAEGYQVNIHAIGDLANRVAVDALEGALRGVCPGEDLRACQARHRFRVEHAQIIHGDDQRRMREIGIIPSIQPTHATSDMRYAEDRLGGERVRAEAYRMKSLWGLNPVLGSDFPVEPPDPFRGIYAAVTRRSPSTGAGEDAEHPGLGWHSEEAIGLDEALWGVTGGAAHGAFLEGKAGVIREGALADWVVLDEPLEGMDVERLRGMQVRETWMGGRRVYRR